MPNGSSTFASVSPLFFKLAKCQIPNVTGQFQPLKKNSPDLREFQEQPLAKVGWTTGHLSTSLATPLLCGDCRHDKEITPGIHSRTTYWCSGFTHFLCELFGNAIDQLSQSSKYVTAD